MRKSLKHFIFVTYILKFVWILVYYNIFECEIFVIILEVVIKMLTLKETLGQSLNNTIKILQSYDALSANHHFD